MKVFEGDSRFWIVRSKAWIKRESRSVKDVVQRVQEIHQLFSILRELDQKLLVHLNPDISELLEWSNQGRTNFQCNDEWILSDDGRLKLMEIMDKYTNCLDKEREYATKRPGDRQHIERAKMLLFVTRRRKRYQPKAKKDEN
jgi:hypothetical protein